MDLLSGPTGGPHMDFFRVCLAGAALVACLPAAGAPAALIPAATIAAVASTAIAEVRLRRFPFVVLSRLFTANSSSFGFEFLRVLNTATRASARRIARAGDECRSRRRSDRPTL